MVRADIAPGVTHKNRMEISIEALRQYLERGSNENFWEAVVELYLENYVQFEKLVKVIGRQNAEAIRASKHVFDRGEELADKRADR